MVNKLKHEWFSNLINKPEKAQGKTFTFFIQALIILSLLTFSLETIPNLKEWQYLSLQYFEIFCIVIFTVEYILRIVFEKKSVKYIFSFYGIIDLISILPFYISLGFDLRSIRIFRVFRLFRILKLTRYNKALQHFQSAIRHAKEEIMLFLLLTAILLFLSALGIYYFENEAQPEKFSSIFHSLWWATCTITTVGYGDVIPITLGGKIFTFIILIIGLGTVTVPAGIVASAFSNSYGNEKKQ